MARQQRSGLDFRNVSRITNLPDALDPQEPATLAQLKAAIEGLAWKDDVVVSTQGNIDIASPGSSVDGVTMSAGQRVLVRAQTDETENGIFAWNGAAVAMSRTLDADTFQKLEQAVVGVQDGTDAGVTFRQTEIGGTLGTDDVLWTNFGTAAPAASETVAGVAEIATQVETDAGSDDSRIVTPAKLAAWSGRKLKYTTLIGDNSNTSYTVTHNLGTRDVHVMVRAAASPYDEVFCDVEHTSTTQITLIFDEAPTTNELSVTVLG